MSADDDLRFALSSPQAAVFGLVRAKLTGDAAALDELFEIIERGQLWQSVAVIAVAELFQEVAEHRGELALDWIDARIQHGLDP
jgi:hypothetical protein